MSDARETSPGQFAWRVTAAHVATYLAMGLLASTLMNYGAWWDSPWMQHYRPMDSPWVAMGPALQLVRGAILGVVLYPFRRVVLNEPKGWLKLWGLLVGIGILSTYAAAPASVEGVIYTELPLSLHVFGMPEVYGQSLLTSLCLVGWYRRPHRAWGLVLGGGVALAWLFGLAGVFLAPPAG